MKNILKKRGFALTEVLLAIAVIVIIGIVVYPVYKNARVNSQVESVVNSMNMLQSNMVKLYQSQGGNYNNVSMTVVDQAGLMPEGFTQTGLANSGCVPSDGYQSNVWSLPVCIESSGGPASFGSVYVNNQGFTIQVYVPDTETCIKLVQRVGQSFQGIGTGWAQGNILGGSPSAPIPKIDNSALLVTCTSNGNVFPKPLFFSGY